MLVVIAVFIIRPNWVSEIMLRLPLLKSMRWPFREFLQFQFFFHLFLVLRRPGFQLRARVCIALAGVALFVPPLFLHPPPTFSPRDEDRALLFSGAFDRYWDKVRPLLGPDDHVAVIIPPNIYPMNKSTNRYSLIGTFDYACAARFINVWGWSQTTAPGSFLCAHHAAPLFRAYTPSQKAALLAERPALRFITLESMQLLKITLSSADGAGYRPDAVRAREPANKMKSAGRARSAWSASLKPAAPGERTRQALSPGSEVAVYGSGTVAGELIDALTAKGIRVQRVLDGNTSRTEIKGRAVGHPDDPAIARAERAQLPCSSAFLTGVSTWPPWKRS